MKAITLKKDDLFDLIGNIIGYGIETNDQWLIKSARTIESLLNLNDLEEDEEEYAAFYGASLAEGYEFILE